jgi:hypothetical protein
MFTETVKSSISHIEKVNTETLSVETIRSLTKGNTVVKVKFLKKSMKRLFEI